MSAEQSAERVSLDLSSIAASRIPSTIRFATYEGSGEVVHPDVVSFPEPWQGHRFWNAITPYPNSAIRYENPSLFASDDGDGWLVPTGTRNPLATTSRGYLSDPDMVFDPATNSMWLYYREVETRNVKGLPEIHLADHVWLTTSTDAVKWSTPRRLFTDSGRFVVSPTIVRRAEGDWRMYQIDAGRVGCSAKSSSVVMRRSTDGVKWTAPSPIALQQPGYVGWHFDVQYVPSRHEYWSLIAAYPAARGCTATSLFLATSTDGIKWETYPTPVLAPGELPQFSSAVYRSTFAVTDDGNVTIWYSGAKQLAPGAKKRPPRFAWSAAVTHTTVDVLFARVKDASGATPLDVVPGPAARTFVLSGSAP